MEGALKPPLPPYKYSYLLAYLLTYFPYACDPPWLNSFSTLV